MMKNPCSLLSHIHRRAAAFRLDCKPYLRSGRTKIIADPGEDLQGEHNGKAGRDVALFAPLYLSNVCPNDCAYCGFRQSATFERTRLSFDEALREANYLAEVGFRTIDLVTGEIPTDTFVAYVAEIIEGIRKETLIERINLNLGALSVQQYQRLQSAGATGYHLYQETYDPVAYHEVHRHGLKRDMAHRLEASRWAVEAGFRSIGLGILLGLGDPISDLACLCAHADILTEIQPDLVVGFSLPRIQHVDEACDYTVAFEVSDELFTKFILFLRKTFPHAQLTLTTREPPALRDRLLPLGITKISAESKTEPGGYAVRPNRETEQFSISDRRSLVKMTHVIADLGLQPVLSQQSRSE